MIQVLMVALAEFITKMDFFCGHLNIQRPLFGGFFCGLLLGDVKTGIIMGITLELIFIGSFSVGSRHHRTCQRQQFYVRPLQYVII